MGGSLRVRAFWGRAVVSTNSMPVGQFLVGNFANCAIADRMGAVIDISPSHDDYFIKNKLAIRCEERISVVSLDSGRSLRYGSVLTLDPVKFHPHTANVRGGGAGRGWLPRAGC